MISRPVGKVNFNGLPVMVGAGAFKHVPDAKRSLSTIATVTGSYLHDIRPGNHGSKLFYPPDGETFHRIGFGLNAFGMPTAGFETAGEQLRQLPSNPFPHIVSLAAFSVDNYLSGIEFFNEFEDVAAIECNFGCPNTQEGEIMSFSPTGLTDFFTRLRNIPSAKRKPIWVKFSPYSNPNELNRVATLVAEHADCVDAVVTMNTFPNAFLASDCIDAKETGGYAGLSGPAVKPIALGQVRQFRAKLPQSVDVIGVGGVTTGNDVVDFLNAGAQAVQMTSYVFWNGGVHGIWEHLLNPETGNRLAEFLD